MTGGGGGTYGAAMDDRIIDLSEHLDDGSDEPTFAMWGGEGERSRFALPVWRALHLLRAERGGIVRTDSGGAAHEPLFLLDLGREPARRDFDSAPTEALRGREAPAVQIRAGVAAVLLATDAEGRWFLLAAGEEVGELEPTPADRDDLLFVAGECAGLLVHRGLGGGSEP